MTDSGPFHLFEVYGIELEYMVVDADDLRVRPLADQVFHAVTGAYEGEYEHAGIGWSNELVNHVVELKTATPVPSLSGLVTSFQRAIADVERILERWNARLMPTAMHPWMDPLRETVLWAHDCSPIYERFHAIFDCRGHGWSNLQSLHINLPFCGDAEFGRLHAAIRILLPILPALAASSPLVEGRRTGALDNRLEYYRQNARRVPSVSGRVIPDSVSSRQEYEERILEPIYRDLEPHDPEGILRHEWVNARGCIARFERETIEIRVLDVQESPRADLAIAALITAVLRSLADRLTDSSAATLDVSTEMLFEIFQACARDGEAARITAPEYAEALGLAREPVRTAGEIWAELHRQSATLDARGNDHELDEPLRLILERGTLARRISRAVGESPSRDWLRAIYHHLCDCLRGGILFDDRDLGARR